MEVLNPTDVLKKLQETETFQTLKKEHPDSFLSHFFCPLTKDFQAKANWDIGYYDSQDGKITIFTHQGEANFVLKPEEEVFKKDETKVEALDISKVKFSFSEAVKMLKEKMSTLFPHEQMGDGFIILQNFSHKILWNFTFMSLSLQFLNVKINAETGEIDSHQVVNVVQQDLPAK